ncbi:hypothetical protein niasHS_015436 [Heterodera schachtii]|uniref:DNA-directed DNA polymerase n=1 Tax=Heterodera schachtii TaxID=97005 RepID=A0ABD2HU43_HETSC
MGGTSQTPLKLSIDYLLSIPNKKPRLGFLINELLGEMIQDGAGTSLSSSKTTKDYVRKLNNTVEHVPRFQYTKVKSRFSIEDVPADPEGLLAGIFQYSIDTAVADSHERGIRPTHLGCLISSPLFTGGTFQSPSGKSRTTRKKQQNVMLWGEPFTVVVTTVDRRGLPSKRNLRGGARRALAAVHHRVNDRSLIKCAPSNRRRSADGESGDLLCFPLCITCAKEHPSGGVDPDYRCEHSDQQRGWGSTCTSIELNAALDEGYRVTKVFRVLEYEQSDDQLFRPYIAEFMALKIHASGFDNSIKGHVEKEQQFCPRGCRTTFITDDPVTLAEYLDDNSIEVTSIDQLNDEHILITYLHKKDWVDEHSCSNIVISLWTTSAARLVLLKAMQKVVRSPGSELLYTDTDSLILVHPEELCPLKTGTHLGQFTDEYPDHDIVEFCSGRAKQYGLCLRRKGAEANALTLNYDVLNNQGMRYETFKKRKSFDTRQRVTMRQS